MSPFYLRPFYLPSPLLTISTQVKGSSGPILALRGQIYLIEGVLGSTRIGPLADLPANWAQHILGPNLLFSGKLDPTLFGAQFVVFRHIGPGKLGPSKLGPNKLGPDRLGPRNFFGSKSGSGKLSPCISHLYRIYTAKKWEIYVCQFFDQKFLQLAFNCKPCLNLKQLLPPLTIQEDFVDYIKCQKLFCS